MFRNTRLLFKSKHPGLVGICNDCCTNFSGYNKSESLVVIPFDHPIRRSFVTSSSLRIRQSDIRWSDNQTITTTTKEESSQSKQETLSRTTHIKSQSDGQPGEVDQTSDYKIKYMYEGKLRTRIMYVKTASILTTTAILGGYTAAIMANGLKTSIAATGLIFTPFIFSPFAIHWIFKRYVTKLYYNYQDDTFTLHHYGVLLNKKELTFKREDVERTLGSDILDNFRVKGRPFFLHQDDLIDPESIHLYKKMMSLD